MKASLILAGALLIVAVCLLVAGIEILGLAHALDRLR